MSVEPLTPSGFAIKKLKRLVSLSSIFQAGVGVDSAAAALEYIHCPRKQASKKQNDKPFAVVTLPGMGGLDPELFAGGAANHFRLAGGLDLLFVRDVGDHANEEDELIDFLNWAEGIWGDILDLAAVDDHLAVVAAPIAYGPVKSGDRNVAGQKAQKPFYKIVFEIRWRS